MTSGHQQAQAQPDVDNCTYNLFRNKSLPELICAVPEDRPVPAFIGSEQWSFEQPLRPNQARPSGFDSRAAQAGARFNGFYLFHALTAIPTLRATLELVLGHL
ncbi:hypothetical protein [Microvirga calopogonii]|uniref:hypothetical protein n=1 Tax=Microvirga calopogonii TaxID=2078013 RepID=UPI001FE204E4|nr:hypothetical protein [Microvirga calopogonii]